MVATVGGKLAQPWFVVWLPTDGLVQREGRGEARRSTGAAQGAVIKRGDSGRNGVELSRPSRARVWVATAIC